MKVRARRQAIMEFMMDAEQVSVEQIADRFGVSRMTVHRDLDELESEKLLRKIRGGATLQASTEFESDFRYRSRLAVSEKRKIAQAAVRKIEPGQCIILDDGSTIAEMATILRDCRPLTVISGNMSVIQVLSKVEGIKLISLGGEYDNRYNCFFGLLAELTLQSVRADQAFIATSSVNGDVAFHQDQTIVKKKQAILSASQKTHLLSDHAKFDKTALHVVARLDQFDSVITGGPISDKAKQAILDCGTKLEILD